jgi:hypothetical protein
MAANTNKTYRFGECSFDTSTRVLRRKESVIKLSPKNKSVLVVLLDGPSTQEQLYSSVWRDESRAYARVHNAVWLINKTIGFNLIERRDDGYALSLPVRSGGAGLDPPPPASSLDLHYPKRLKALMALPVGCSILFLIISLGFHDELGRGKAILIASAGLVALGYSLFRNYVPFLPTHYGYKIFYDEKGILEAVEKMSSPRHTFVRDWKIKRRKYFAKIDQLIFDAGYTTADFFGGDRGTDYVRSSGQAIHLVKYSGVWQRYAIDRVSGFVRHRREREGLEVTELGSTYDLVDNADNLICVDVKLLLKPVFRTILKQRLSARSSEIYDDFIVCLTKTKRFPLGLKLSLFCSESEQGLTPLAYCVYTDAGFLKQIGQARSENA